MKYDVAVVGGGMAGLTSAAYLSKNGYNVVLCEQQEKVGGLVTSFTHNGFVLDGGIRAVENSGILFPMLKQLGIEVPFVKNDVSLRIDNQQLVLEKDGFLESYRSFMNALFPAEQEAIANIVKKIDKAMKYMHVLYGFDNPLFVDLKEDLPYALSLLPWLAKFLTTIGKIDALSEPIDEYLSKLTSDPVLVDMFAQHFFYKTPAFFALSYFSLYLDYQYPLGGTGTLTQKMQEFIELQGGEIRLNCTIDTVDCVGNCITDAEGNKIEYTKMIWAADSTQLYTKLRFPSIKHEKLKKKLQEHQALLQSKMGSDSIFTVYLLLAVGAENLSHYIGPHVFYTPKQIGLSSKPLHAKKQQMYNGTALVGTKEQVFDWARGYIEASTFEISCPAMRDKTLAPEGQSALIISCLFDYGLSKQIEKKGYYDEFKRYCENIICDIILENLLPEARNRTIDCFSSSPLTIKRMTGNTGGSITGWGLANNPLPAVTKMSKIASAIQTDIPNVYQAGQWTFAPSGLPIAILTGKLAADAIKK